MAAGILVLAVLGLLRWQGLERTDKWASIASGFAAVAILILARGNADRTPDEQPSQRRGQKRRPPRPGGWRRAAIWPFTVVAVTAEAVLRRLSLGDVFLAALLTTSLATSALAAIPPPSAPVCSHPVQLNVLTSAEKAGAVRRLAGDFEDLPRQASGKGCQRVDVQVSVAVSADVAIEALSQGWSSEYLKWIGPEPHVWLPDSSLDHEQVRAALAGSRGREVELVNRGSIAISPLVLGMPAELGQRRQWPDHTFRWKDLVRSAETASGRSPEGLLVGRANPRSSSAGMAATVALYQSALGQARLDDTTFQAAGAVQTLNRAEKAVPVSSEDAAKLLCPLRQASPVRSRISAVLASEKMIYDYNFGLPLNDSCAATGRPEVQFEFRYEAEWAPLLDHPFVSVRWKDLPINDRRRNVMEEFLLYITSSGQETLRTEGFRDKNGQIGHNEGARRNLSVGFGGPLTDNVDTVAVLDAWEQLRKPARVLMIVDVSASMDEAFDPTGDNRLKTARGAIQESLRLIGDRDEIGLWAFPDQDDARPAHREVVPLGDGHSQGDKVTSELEQLETVSDNADLYDTAYAAVEHLTGLSADATTDAVVVVADGRDTGSSGHSAVDIAALITNSGQKPVRVFVIAFAEDVCTTFELRQFTEEAGGACSEVDDADDISRALDGVATGLWGGRR